MGPAQIIALVRDVLIVGGIAYILYFIHHADQNAAKVVDLQAVQKQMAANAAEESKWEDQRETAEAQRQVDMQTITAAIASQRTPIIVYRPAGGGSVPGNPASSSSGAPCPGGANTGSGIDIRSAINAVELKYEAALASCRSILDSWP